MKMIVIQIGGLKYVNEKQKEQLGKIGINDLNIVTKLDVIKAATAYIIKKIDKDAFYYCTSDQIISIKYPKGYEG